MKSHLMKFQAATSEGWLVAKSGRQTEVTLEA